MNIHKIAPIQEGWNIDVSIQNGMPEISQDKHSILKLRMGSSLSLKNPVVINADPFLFVHKGWLFLFYEELHYYNSGGNIVMVKTNDLEHWSKPVTILDDPVHFSFPYVFEDGGSVYMIPESGCSNSVRLYKADDDSLESFSLVKFIFNQEKRPDGIESNFCDNIIYKKNNIYYLFTSIYDGKNYRLELYFAERLDGSYRLHPLSPIVLGNKFGRNGGPFMEYNGKLFRVAQDCTQSYGENIHLLEIIELTPLTYKEKVSCENLIPRSDPFYHNGGHQLSFATFHNQTIVATDGKGFRKFYLLKTCHWLTSPFRKKM